MPGLDDIKKLAGDHHQQVDQGLEKAGDAAGTKFGHDDQIDKGVDRRARSVTRLVCHRCQIVFRRGFVFTLLAFLELS